MRCIFFLQKNRVSISTTTSCPYKVLYGIIIPVIQSVTQTHTHEMSLLDLVKPGISRRADFALRRTKCALLIIDVQTYFTYPEQDYFHKTALPRAIQNIETLAQQFRSVRDTPSSSSTSASTGCEVIFTYVQSCTNDGRDVSLDYKLSGPMLANIPRMGDTDIFLRDCTPDQHTGKGDILLPKTACSVFQSTNLDYILRNLGIEQVVVCGQLTDECVESAVRDGADLGYLMTVPEDACAAISAERHKIGLQGMHGFCRILKAAHITWEIAESVEAFRSENVSLELLTTFLKGRGFADAAMEVASAFTGSGRTLQQAATTVINSTTNTTPDDQTNGSSNGDVVTVSSVVEDNIIRQQEVPVKPRKKKYPIAKTTANVTSPRNCDVDSVATTPPQNNTTGALPLFSKNNGRGRDPSELVTPDLGRSSMSSSQYQLQQRSQSRAASSKTIISPPERSSVRLRRSSVPVDLDDESDHNKKKEDPSVLNEFIEL
jgi:ureidoacrylate peracid hydrolase